MSRQPNIFINVDFPDPDWPIRATNSFLWIVKSIDFNALINSKMALNLSRGKPTKYYSSNRIASIMGNGLLTFIDKKVQFNDFFNTNEIVFYDDVNDLSEKIKYYSKNDILRKKISQKGQAKYFKLFNEKKISQYLIDISIGKKASLFQ